MGTLAKYGLILDTKSHPSIIFKVLPLLHLQLIWNLSDCNLNSYNILVHCEISFHMRPSLKYKAQYITCSLNTFHTYRLSKPFELFINYDIIHVFYEYDLKLCTSLIISVKWLTFNLTQKSSFSNNFHYQPAAIYWREH